MRGLTTAVMLAVLLQPGAAIAELSDKMPTIGEHLTTGLVLAVIGFVLARLCRWLVAASLAACTAMSLYLLELLTEEPMRKALLAEQGPVYFAAMVAAIAAVPAGGAIGAWLNVRSRHVTCARVGDPKL